MVGHYGDGSAEEMMKGISSILYSLELHLDITDTCYD
jgi:hypothetical protein